MMRDGYSVRDWPIIMVGTIYMAMNLISCSIVVRVSEELQKKQKQKSSSGEQPTSEGTAQKVTVPQSDAVLNCPACLSTLCLDCQR